MGEPQFGSLALVCCQISCSTQWLRELHVAGLRTSAISQSPCTQIICNILGGPFHSGAPRLCLPCLPCRDATAHIRCISTVKFKLVKSVTHSFLLVFSNKCHSPGTYGASLCNGNATQTFSAHFLRLFVTVAL